MKKVVGSIIAGVLLVGITATTVYATVSNYYAELLYNQKEQMQIEVKEVYDELSQRNGEDNHRNLVVYVDGKRIEILDNVTEHVKSVVTEDSRGRLEEHTKIIDEVAEQLEAELIEYVNQLREE